MDPATTITIRTATTADHGAMAQILRAGYQHMASSEYHDHVVTPANWADDATAVLVAVHAERVVGVVAFALPDSELFEDVDPPLGDATFRFLGVAPDMRGRRIAQRLVQECLDLATAAGAHRMGIYTMDHMASAHRLYERMGFCHRADLDVDFTSGAGLVYTKDLTADAGDHFPPPGPIPEVLPHFMEVRSTPSDPRPTC